MADLIKQYNKIAIGVDSYLQENVNNHLTLHSGSSISRVLTDLATIEESPTDTAVVFYDDATKKLVSDGSFLFNATSDTLTVSNMDINGDIDHDGYAVQNTPAFAVTTNSTNYKMGSLILDNAQYDISNGITDSGYRITHRLGNLITNSSFLGTLDAQYGLYIDHGSDTGSGAGTVTNSFGILLNGVNGGSATITNKYGIYQYGSEFKNYFQGNTGMGNIPLSDTQLYVRNRSTQANIFKVTSNNGTDRFTVNDAGNTGIGRQPTNAQLAIRNKDTQAYILHIASSNGTARFSVHETGYIQSMGPYNYTTTSAANMYIDSGGYFRRSTSSRLAKTDIEHNIDPNLTLALKPASYTEKATGNPFYGYIAEEVNEVSARFATNQEEEGLMGLDMNAISAAQTATIQMLNNEIITLKQEVELIKNKLV